MDKRNTSRMENLRDMQTLLERQELARVGSSAEASSGPGGAAAAAAAASPGAPGYGASAGFHFICECYFLTATTMHLGLLKVRAGERLFSIPEDILLTIETAIADPGVGRSLRAMSNAQAGFDTFALAAMLAAERVRRGA